MRIIEVKSCYDCPEKISLDKYRIKFWCPVSSRVFVLGEDVSEDDVSDWCELSRLPK